MMGDGGPTRYDTHHSLHHLALSSQAFTATITALCARNSRRRCVLVAWKSPDLLRASFSASEPPHAAAGPEVGMAPLVLTAQHASKAAANLGGHGQLPMSPTVHSLRIHGRQSQRELLSHSLRHTSQQRPGAAGCRTRPIAFSSVDAPPQPLRVKTAFWHNVGLSFSVGHQYFRLVRSSLQAWRCEPSLLAALCRHIDPRLEGRNCLFSPPMCRSNTLHDHLCLLDLTASCTRWHSTDAAASPHCTCAPVQTEKVEDVMTRGTIHCVHPDTSVDQGGPLEKTLVSMPIRNCASSAVLKSYPA